MESFVPPPLSVLLIIGPSGIEILIAGFAISLIFGLIIGPSGIEIEQGKYNRFGCAGL